MKSGAGATHIRGPHPSVVWAIDSLGKITPNGSVLRSAADRERRTSDMELNLVSLHFHTD